jgi:hypothetical protein
MLGVGVHVHPAQVVGGRRHVRELRSELWRREVKALQRRCEGAGVARWQEVAAPEMNEKRGGDGGGSCHGEVRRHKHSHHVRGAASTLTIQNKTPNKQRLTCQLALACRLLMSHGTMRRPSSNIQKPQPLISVVLPPKQPSSGVDWSNACANSGVIHTQATRMASGEGAAHYSCTHELVTPATPSAIKKSKNARKMKRTAACDAASPASRIGRASSPQGIQTGTFCRWGGRLRGGD